MATKKKDAPAADGLDIPAASVEIRPLDSLAAYARNARTHDDANVAQLMGSIIEFGFTNPVLADADGIIAGHGRCMAARKLYEQGRTIRLPNGKELPKGTVPVLDVSGWSEAKRRAYILADNRLALASDWDYDMLAVELDELRDMDFDLSLLGFEQQELNDLIGTPNLGPAPVEGEDDAPEPPANPATMAGDVWLLGKHRLMCGDSTDAGSVALLMNGEKADMVFTDPPYGVEYQSNMRTKSQKFDVLKNDDVFLDISPIVEKFSTGWVFVWTSWKVQTKWIDLFSAFGYPTNIVIWHKPGGGIGDLKRTFSSDYEVALVWHRGAELCGKRIGSVWTINKDGASTYVHPTQKPVALADEAIDKTTLNGAAVLDLFGGSGTTMIAAEKNGRVARLMELDPRYCDVIVKRWQEFTGQHATLEGDGRTFDEIAQERIGESAEA